MEYRRSLMLLVGALAAMAMILLLVVTNAYPATIEVTLEWDPNQEEDLKGYKIYYKVGSRGEPYDGTGAPEGNSPINVGNVTTTKVSGFPENTLICFVATAYDKGGLESGYSNEACLEPMNVPPSPPNLHEINLYKIITELLKKDILLSRADVTLRLKYRKLPGKE
jgi:hypothetical protein